MPDRPISRGLRNEFLDAWDSRHERPEPTPMSDDEYAAFSTEQQAAADEASLELYTTLRALFSTMDEAIEWYSGWVRDGQRDPMAPDDPEPVYSLRAMAYHCSRVLEGADVDPSPWNCIGTDYLATEYGARIYYEGNR